MSQCGLQHTSHVTGVTKSGGSGLRTCLPPSGEACWHTSRRQYWSVRLMSAFLGDRRGIVTCTRTLVFEVVYLSASGRTGLLCWLLAPAVAEMRLMSTLLCQAWDIMTCLRPPTFDIAYLSASGRKEIMSQLMSSAEKNFMSTPLLSSSWHSTRHKGKRSMKRTCASTWETMCPSQCAGPHGRQCAAFPLLPHQVLGAGRTERGSRSLPS